MKWVEVISCFLFLSFAESKNLPRKYRDVEQPVTRSQPRVQALKDIRYGIKDIETLSLGVFSQYLQQATFEEVHRLVEDVTTFAKKCFADGVADPTCNDSLFSFFHDQICAAEGLPEKYGYADCCAKAGSERHDCLISHKNATPGFIPPLQEPDAEEEDCERFQANADETIQRFIYERARRDPIIMVQTFFEVADEYKKVLTTCCQMPEKLACFKEKAPPVSQRLREFSLEQKINCFLLKKKGTRALEMIEHILLSQQFSKATVSTIFILAKHLAETQIDCCRGDSVKCYFMEADAVDYICNHQNTMSSKLKEVCEWEGVDKIKLLFRVGNDDTPSDLPPIAREFIEDKDVCRHYAENEAAHLGKFRYETGRRHPELPPSLLLRNAEDYEQLLKNCCAMEHPEQCLPQGDGLLEKQVSGTLELVRLNQNLYAKVGEDCFQKELLGLFSKKIPQMPFEELYPFTKELTEIAKECSHQNNNKALVCSERKLMHCITDIGVDAEYTRITLDPTFHSDLCSLTEEQQLLKRQTLHIDLVKSNPNITNEQLATIKTEFQLLLTECCKAENEEECFKEKGQKLADHIKDPS